MNRLLSAGLVRIKRDMLFWGGVIFIVVMSPRVIIGSYLQKYEYNYTAGLNHYFFSGFILICIIMPIFCSLFLGTEYSDGTIRNKIIIGHTRNSIYLSNLVLSFLSGLIMCLAYMITISAIGYPLLGIFVVGLDDSLTYILCGIVMLAAAASIYTLIAMLCHNKTTSVVIIILLTVLLFIFIITDIKDVLNITRVVSMTSLNPGGQLAMEEVIDLNDFGKTKRVIFEFLYYSLPFGQVLQISNISAWRVPLLSLMVVFGTTASGLFFFRKKNIK